MKTSEWCLAFHDVLCQAQQSYTAIATVWLAAKWHLVHAVCLECEVELRVSTSKRVLIREGFSNVSHPTEDRTWLTDTHMSKLLIT